MPELPEVEIAARNLRRWAVGRRIEAAEAEEQRAAHLPTGAASAFRTRCRDGGSARCGASASRILVRLDGTRGDAPSHSGLVSHLGMTGQVAAAGRGRSRRPSHSRARLHLEDGATLHYRDPRLFGRLRLVPGARFDEVPGGGRARAGSARGRASTWRGWRAALARRKAAVKVAMLDQSLLPGVGNIQASEALFRAQDRSAQAAGSIDPSAGGEDAGGGGARSVRETIAREEGPEPRYVEEPGRRIPFCVYGREGERCPRCRRERNPARGAGAALDVLLPEVPAVTAG